MQWKEQNSSRRKHERRRGETGNRRTGLGWRTGTEDAERGDGEQENGICLENRNQRTRRGETGNRRTGFVWRTGTEDGGETGNRRTGLGWRTGMEDEARGDKVQENRIGLENMKLHKV